MLPVATLTGNRFGETNAASRAIYGLVGASAAYQAVRLVQTRRDHDLTHPPMQ